MKLIYHPNKWLEKKVKPFDFTTHDPHLVSKEMITKGLVKPIVEQI